MSPLLSKVMGLPPGADERVVYDVQEPVTEDVPVPCAAMPRKSFRDRLEQSRRKDRGVMQRVMGESAQGTNDPIIPKDADEIEVTGQPIKKGIKPVKDTVLEPRDPYGEKEKMMTPQAALVAPDVTPDADQPLDPATVPGTRSTSFRTTDAENEPDREQPDSGTVSKKAMDALLGRSKPPTPMEPDAVETTEAAAYGMLGVKSPAAQHLDESAPSGEAVLKEGAPMPEHVHTNGQSVYRTFRKFTG